MNHFKKILRMQNETTENQHFHNYMNANETRVTQNESIKTKYEETKYDKYF